MTAVAGDAAECFRTAIWASDNGMIVLVLDGNNKVTKKDFEPIRVNGIFAQARRWLASR